MVCGEKNIFNKEKNMKTKQWLFLMAIGVGLTAAGLARAEDPFADHVVYNWDGTTATYTPGTGDNMTYGPFHSSALWNNPLAILGYLNVLDRDDTNMGATGEFREINVVWPAWYQGTTQVSAANTPYNSNPTGAPKTNNGCGLAPRTISGVMKYPQIVVEFDELIENDPHNPYGIDFIVHGNPFFATGKMVYKDSNMNEYTLSAFGGGGEFGASGAGAVFEERVIVSVAQSLDGPWYTYTTAFGDWFFPTQPLAWDRTKINTNIGQGRTSIYGDWTDQENDWTKPVNPALADLAGEAAEAGSGTWGYFGNRSVADALDLYTGSAGGTGFDLAESGFEWIKYVKFTDPNNKQGEICGVADVAPVSIGDKQSMSWHNVYETGQNALYYQDVNDPARNLVSIAFTDINNVSHIRADTLTDLSGYDPINGTVLAAYLLEIGKIFPSEGDPLAFEATIELYVGDTYTGDGSDLAVHQWTGEDWTVLTPSSYDATTKLLSVENITTFSVFAVVQVPVTVNTLTGTVTLQSLTAGMEVGKTLTIQIGSGGETLTATLGAGGTYTATCATTTAGTYDIYFKVSHWLRVKLSSVTLAAGSNSLSTPTLLNGDVNGDNNVTSADLGVLKGNYLKTGVGLAGDLNEDGSVTSADLGILKGNYLKSGD
jgi:hypothetical protein